MERSNRELAGCTGWGWTDAEFCRAIEIEGRVSSQTRIDRPWEKVHYIKSEFDWIQFGSLFLSLVGPGARPCRLAWMDDEKMKAQRIDFFWTFCWWKKGRQLEWHNQNKGGPKWLPIKGGYRSAAATTSQRDRVSMGVEGHVGICHEGVKSASDSARLPHVT